MNLQSLHLWAFLSTNSAFNFLSLFTSIQICFRKFEIFLQSFSAQLMVNKVAREISFSWKPFSTDVAKVRHDPFTIFIGQVSSLMTSKIAGILKRLSTDITCVWFLTSMGSDVFFKIKLDGDLFSTIWTLCVVLPFHFFFLLFFHGSEKKSFFSHEIPEVN